MTLIKHIPDIKLYVPRELRPGGAHEGRVAIDARREVKVEWIRLEVRGAEQVTVGSGNSAKTHRRETVRLRADLSGRGPRTIGRGRTELPFRFDLPPGIAPSYRGPRALCSYTAVVRASIPWWPDAVASFELRVVPPPAPRDEARPLLFSTAPAGPSAHEAYVEGSLASSVFEPGDTVEGALALGNVAWNDYREVKVGLVAVETPVLPRSTVAGLDMERYAVSLKPLEPREGASIPFRFRLPEVMPTSYVASLWRLDWFFEVVARVGWASTVRASVPVTVAPRAEARASRQLRAPPTVGSERVESIWRGVASETGLAYEEGELAGAVDEVAVRLRREHRGRSGVFLVGTLEYPSLGLDLEVVPVGGVAQLLRAGLVLGTLEWDGRHAVDGREPAQVRAAMTLLRRRLLDLGSTTLSDERARVEVRGAGQTHRELSTFCRGVLSLAAAVGPARAAIPPPAAMADGLASWVALAQRLDGTLARGTMSVAGALDGMPVEVRTEWTESGDALRTVLDLVPLQPAPEELSVLLEGGEARSGLSSWPAPTSTARELASGLLRGSRALEIASGRIRLALDAPVLDARPLEQRLVEMAQLASALRPERGPFR